MANKGPTSLTAASALGGTELGHFIQGGNSRKVTVNQAKTYILTPFAANGIAVRTAAETFSARTITGTAAEITVADGNGVSGNPTLSLPAALTFTGKTVTGGTFNGSQVDQIEVGHASDTTLARASAGNLSIEGNVIYRAGGTDVPLADGGTGASLADPGADRVMFWDDSAGVVTWLSLDPGLEISGTTLRTARGTSFPGTPASGDRFLRTDRNIEYYYDGTQWLSTTQYSFELRNTDALMPFSATNTYRATHPFNDDHDIYIEKFFGNYFITTTTASNYFVATFAGVSLSSQGITQNTWTKVSGVASYLMAKDQPSAIGPVVTETGTCSGYCLFAATYRLVG